MTRDEVAPPSAASRPAVSAGEAREAAQLAEAGRDTQDVQADSAETDSDGHGQGDADTESEPGADSNTSDGDQANAGESGGTPAVSEAQPEANDSEASAADDSPAIPPLRIALIGHGRIAELAFGPVLQRSDAAVLWSVCGRDLERARNFAQAHAAAAPQVAHTEVESFVRDEEFDAVIIASPDRLHLEQARQCIDAGKHVLIEKPVGTDPALARELATASRGAGMCVGVAYHLRWHRGHRAVHAMVQAGELGTLTHARAHWTFRAEDSENWRNQPESGRWWSLAATGTHLLDLLRWMMTPQCGEVVDISGHSDRSHWNSAHDERCMAQLRFESGATAELSTATTYKSPTRLEIYGTQGFVVCDDTLGPHGRGQIRTHRGPLVYNHADPFEGEVLDFIAAIREGRDPEVSLEEGARNIELLARLADWEPNDAAPEVTPEAEAEQTPSADALDPTQADAEAEAEAEAEIVDSDEPTERAAEDPAETDADPDIAQPEHDTAPSESAAESAIDEDEDTGEPDEAPRSPRSKRRSKSTTKVRRSPPKAEPASDAMTESEGASKTPAVAGKAKRKSAKKNQGRRKSKRSRR